MDVVIVLVFLVFIVMIAYYFKDIKDLIIPTRKTTLDIVSLVISITVILMITYLYAKTWSHYILVTLIVIFFIFSFIRTGITSKGILFIGGLTAQGKWSKIHSVQVSLKKDVIVSIILNKSNSREIIHCYKKENYNKIIALLLKNLSNEKINIK